MNGAPRVQRVSYSLAALLLIWFALFAGLGEAGGLAVRKLVNGNPIRTTPHAVWLAPLAEILIFALPLLVLLGIGRFMPRARSMRAVVFLLAFLAFLSMVLVPSWLSWHAELLLAGGLGIQTAHFAAANPPRFVRLVRRTTVPLLAFFIVLALTVSAYPWVRERRHLASLPDADASRPNILLIIWDTVRARSLGLYGNTRPTTPSLERWAAEAGVVFETALAPASWTLPSHAVMFTGKHAYRLMPEGFWSHGLPDEPITLAEYLSAHGYRTAAFVANTVFADHERGLDQGFSRYSDYPLDFEQVLLSSAIGRTVLEGRNRFDRTWFAHALGRRNNFARKDADRVNEDFLGWLEEGDASRPFFAFLNLFDAHAPYVPPEPFAGKYDVPFPEMGTIERVRRALGRSKPTPGERAAELAAYEEAITYLDDRLGALLHELEQRGLLSNTIVVLTADHGEAFGEHGLYRHSTSMYEPQLRVPLVISYPKEAPSGRRVAGAISLRSLPVTLMDLAGFARHPFPGTSLRRSWTDAGPAAPRIIYAETMLRRTADSRICTLLIEPLQYITYPERDELYDLSVDPDQRHDVAATDSSDLALMRSELERIGGCPRETGPPDRVADP